MLAPNLSLLEARSFLRVSLMPIKRSPCCRTPAPGVTVLSAQWHPELPDDIAAKGPDTYLQISWSTRFRASWSKLNAVDSSLLIADNSATPAADVTVLTAQWHRWASRGLGVRRSFEIGSSAGRLRLIASVTKVTPTFSGILLPLIL